MYLCSVQCDSNQRACCSEQTRSRQRTRIVANHTRTDRDYNSLNAFLITLIIILNTVDLKLLVTVQSSRIRVLFIMYIILFTGLMYIVHSRTRRNCCMIIDFPAEPFRSISGPQMGQRTTGWKPLHISFVSHRNNFASSLPWDLAEELPSVYTACKQKLWSKIAPTFDPATTTCRLDFNSNQNAIVLAFLRRYSADTSTSQIPRHSWVWGQAVNCQSGQYRPLPVAVASQRFFTMVQSFTAVYSSFIAMANCAHELTIVVRALWNRARIRPGNWTVRREHERHARVTLWCSFIRANVRRRT